MIIQDICSTCQNIKLFHYQHTLCKHKQGSKSTPTVPPSKLPCISTLHILSALTYLKVVCNGKITWAYIVRSLVLVMNIGMYDLVILWLVYPLLEF